VDITNQDATVTYIFGIGERDAVRLFWSAVPGLRPQVIRALAEGAGVPVVCRGGDAIYAGSGFIGVHATQAGTKHVHLPVPAAVEERLSGRTWPAGSAAVTLEMATGETAILMLR